MRWAYEDNKNENRNKIIIYYLKNGGYDMWILINIEYRMKWLLND